MSDIKNTKIFKELKKLDKDLANDVLRNTNSVVELINKKTTINFPSYTNHDINHSIKIINTIYELIKDNKKLSALEYALIIYASVFHDIGMAVSDKEKTNIKENSSKYLYGQNFKLIKENFEGDEEFALQDIVRNAHGKIENDLITTKYKELFNLPNKTINFAEDLGMICQAHTESKSYLESIKTERTKGTYTYNPRFIAILLRVGDVLDIDDSRTPIELYNTIELSEYSDEEWQKNFTIDNTKKIFKRNKLKEIRLEGTCENIKVHRKLLNYIKWIEEELNILLNMTSDMKEDYHIPINPIVQNKIEPRGYTIPDLKLNMDYHAVTNLLMGEAIYGDKKLGLRELIQNSIDACMVKKEHLEIKDSPSKDTYEPTIEINIDEKDNQVIIKDNGMGMNEDIIKNYFLNVGKSYYKSPDFLNFNHNYNPIGNFGIGFLSCFMLSDEVKVITKHFNDKYKYIIDLEKNSQYISFIQEEDNSFESGTTIILHLQNFKSIFEDRYLKEYKGNIISFIQKNILINNFVILFNNKKILNKTENIKNDKTYIININDYYKHLYGNITISKKHYSNCFENKFKYEDGDILYFDNKDFIQLDNFNKINLEHIKKGFDFEYCKIPLLTKKQFDNYNTILDTGHLSYTEAIDSLYEKNEIKTIYLFINKDSFFEEVSIDEFYWEEDNIFSQEKDDEFKTFYIKDIIKNIHNFERYYTIGTIFNKFNALSIKNYFLPYNEIYSFNLKNNIYIKNIKTSTDFNNYLLVSSILIEEININIKDSGICSNIDRSALIKPSENSFNYSILKIIHEYALEHFESNENEKELLRIFINIHYGKESTLERA